MAQSKKTPSYHAILLTIEGVLVYAKYSEPVTHHQLYTRFKDMQIEIKDSFISEDESFNLAEFLLSAISKWVQSTYHEILDRSSIAIQKAYKRNQFVILEIQCKTEQGTEIKVKPSDILAENNNLLSDFS